MWWGQSKCSHDGEKNKIKLFPISAGNFFLEKKVKCMLTLSASRESSTERCSDTVREQGDAVCVLGGTSSEGGIKVCLACGLSLYRSIGEGLLWRSRLALCSALSSERWDSCRREGCSSLHSNLRRTSGEDREADRDGSRERPSRKRWPCLGWWSCRLQRCRSCSSSRCW